MSADSPEPTFCLIAGTFRPKGGLVKKSNCESAFLKLIRKSKHHVVSFETVQGDAATRHAHFIVSVKSCEKPTANFGKALRGLCDRESPDSIPKVAVHLRKCYKGEIELDGNKYSSYLQYLTKDGPPDVSTPIFDNDTWRDLAHDDVPVEERRTQDAWGEMSRFVGLVILNEYDIENVTHMEEAYMDMCYDKKVWQPKKSLAERRLFIIDAYLYHRGGRSSLDEIGELTKTLMPAKDRFDDARRHDVILRRDAKKRKLCEECAYCPPSDWCDDCRTFHGKPL